MNNKHLRDRVTELAKRVLRKLHLDSQTQRAVYWWARRGEVEILSGIGAGLRFDVDGGNPSYALGTNEKSVQDTLASHLTPGGVFYDIGANVGFFTVIGARLVGSNGHVYAFEPVPKNVAAIYKNIGLNRFGNVTVLEMAMSSEDGVGELLVAEYSGGSALVNADPPPDIRSRLPVNIRTIDSLVRDKMIEPPTVVKIDVEGAEFHVLKGMRQTVLDYHPAITFEVDDENLDRLSAKSAKCQEYLHSLGYRIEQLPDSYEYADWHVWNMVARYEVPGLS